MSTRIAPAKSQSVNGDGAEDTHVEGGFVDDIVRGVREALDDVDVGELADQARNWVREHPILTVAAAAGAGFLVAAIYRAVSAERAHDGRGGFLRETAGDLADAVDSRARGLREQASRDIASALSSVTTTTSHPASEGAARPIAEPTQAGREPTDTLKSVLAAIVLTKVGEWLARLK